MSVISVIQSAVAVVRPALEAAQIWHDFQDLISRAYLNSNDLKLGWFFYIFYFKVYTDCMMLTT